MKFGKKPSVGVLYWTLIACWVFLSNGMTAYICRGLIPTTAFLVFCFYSRHVFTFLNVFFIFTAHCELRKVLLFGTDSQWSFLCIWNISEIAERIFAKFTRKTCLIPRSDEFDGQESKVKVTKDKNGIFRLFRRPACSSCLAKHF